MSAATLYAQTGMLRFPAIHENQIVFSYAGDLYTVETTGGTARRLTDHAGYEMFAKFSPNGDLIAFTASFEGSTEVYTMPASGGAPKRITHTATLSRDDVADRMGPNNITVGWRDNATVVYRSRMHSFNAFKGKLYLADTSGAPAGQLPFSVAGWMSYAPDGNKIAYNRVMREFRTWKYYRGGMADDVWVYDPKTDSTGNMSKHEGQDIFPMWIGDKVYFISDRSRVMNLFSYHTKTGALVQETHFTDYDIKFPSAGGSNIIFEKGGFIHVFDTRTSAVQKVDIYIKNTLIPALPEWVDAAAHVSSVSPAAGGTRVLFTARGEVFDVPVKEGITYRRSRTDGVNEREATFSPDGKWMAYFADTDGEDELYVNTVDAGKPRKLTSGSHTYPFGLKWSPDSKSIAWTDRRLRLCITDISTGSTRVVDSSKGGEFTEYGWSPDAKWLAYAKPEAPGRASGVWLYHTSSKQRTAITDPTFNAYAPAFDSEGKYLLYVSDRDFNPLYGKTEWNHVYVDMARIYIVPLTRESGSPFALKNDTIVVKKPAVAAPQDKKSGAEQSKKPSVADKSTKVEPEGMLQRTLALPVEPGEYRDLSCVGDKVYYMTKSASDKKWAMKMYDLKQKKETALGYCTGYVLTPDNKNVLITSSSGKYAMIDLPKAAVKLDEYIDLSGLKISVDKKTEWKQMFAEAHRQYTYYFYDPGMHGVDWDAVKRKYEVLLPHIAHRADLTYLIGEMIGELNVGHAYVGGGDVPPVQPVKTGLLGAEVEKDEATGYFKIISVLPGAPWSETLQSPLTLPGAQAYAGEFITAIDGESVQNYVSIGQMLAGKAERSVELSLLSKVPSGEMRTILVKTLADESALHYHAWVTGNIEKVSQLSGGKVGYIHIPDMLSSGLNEFAKYFYPQLHKEALLIDDRGNGGGNVSQQIIERLSRNLAMYNYARGGDPYVNPYQMHLGPKLMLIDKYSASDGDLFPYRFREYGLGTLVGERTWGGVVGYRGMFKLMDGGYLVRPEFAHLDKEAKNWIIEGEGVSPDVEVTNDPVAEQNGYDAQLETGVKLLLEQIKQNPTPRPVLPPFPDKSK